MLIKELFKLRELYQIFSEFKKDRIDNQYYVPVVGAEPINKEKCDERIKTAQRFNIEIRAYAKRISNQDIKDLRERFTKL